MRPLESPPWTPPEFLPAGLRMRDEYANKKGRHERRRRAGKPCAHKGEADGPHIGSISARIFLVVPRFCRQYGFREFSHYKPRA
eukprot:82043-Rhodomonas_salina.2